MAGETQKTKARELRDLHAAGVLILPNAWDAGSAAMIALAGAQAIATTSGGIAWSLGRADGQHLTRAEMTGRVRQIVAAVTIPVTADIEGGYGPGPEDVALTVEAVVAAGVVGVNFEDSRAPGVPEARLDDVLARCFTYAKAGADGLFVPGLTDLQVITKLAEASPLPVNVMAGPGAPLVAELAAAGVRRVSIGTAIAQVAYTRAQRAATELLTTGGYAELEEALGFGTINGLFSR